MSKGYIYIMTNPSFKEYVKIGWAADVEQLKKDLDGSSAVPFSFKIYATLAVKDSGKIRSDVYIHNLIDMLRPDLRSVEKNESGKIVREREFFQMEPDEAYELLQQVSGLTGGELVKYEETKQEKAEAAAADRDRGRYEATVSARQSFWTGFTEYADTVPEFSAIYKKHSATRDHWLSFGAGKSGVAITLTLNVRQKHIGVEYYITRNKNLFSSLLVQKAEIEKELGFEMEWQPLDECDASRIIVKNNVGDFREFSEEQRQDAFKWMVDHLLKIRKVFAAHC